MTILAQLNSEGTLNGAVTAASWGVDYISPSNTPTTSVMLYDGSPANGTTCVKVIQQAGSALFGALTSLLGGARTDHWGSAVLKFSAFPSASNHIIRGQGTGSTAGWCIDLSSTGYIILRNNANTNVKQSTNPIPLNTWVRIEWHVDQVNNTAQVLIYTTANGLTVTEDMGSTAGTFGSDTAAVQFGAMNTTPTVPAFWIDDLAVGTSKVGPFGAAVVGPPTVNAGVDFTRGTSQGSTTVTCTATPATGGTITGYQWSQVSGPSVTLTNANTATVTVSPPALAGDVVLRCTVTQSG